MPVRYTRVGWQDAPSTDTPIDAANLNHMDNGILALSQEVDTELPLIQEQINDVFADIETQIDEKVPPEVSSWLTEHVDPVGSAVVVDDTLTIQGAAADAKKTGDEISDLKDELDKTNADLDSVSSVTIHGYTRNLINYETCKKDTYISYQDGEEHYIDSTYATDYIEVDGGATYTANIKDQCAWYDASYAFISGLVRLDGTVQAPNNAKYFRTTIHNEYFSQKSIVFVRGDSIGTNPKPVITHASDYTTVLTVGNGKMYGSLKSALNDCVNPSEYNRYLIELYNDYSVPVTEEEKADNSFVGLFVPNWVKVKGIGDRRQITVYLGLGASTSEEAKNRISTFNIQQNSELENLTIIGENCKYAVHDDFEGITDVERHISNCKIISRNTVSHVAWGSGYRSGLTWYFDDCVFINEESTGHPFASHNNRGFEKPAKLIFTNCRFEGGANGGARFGSINTGYTNIINQILFYGNKIGRIYLTETDPTVYGTGIKVTVSGFANTCGNNDVVISNTDGVDYSSYVDLI